MSEVEGTDGRLLADRYRLDGVLGKGGMGTVWRATDETLGRTVAVKELRFPGNVDEEEKRRLVTRTLREAKATARIRGTGAITVYDVVKEDDRPWIVMELIEGRSLSDRIRDDGPLTPRRAAEVGLVVLDVLSAAHREGILHRDVKPSNVLISDDARVVLSDFGIAQIDGDPSVTSTGMLVGAPSYISPERARGQKPGPPADLWSLGALLFAAVEGHPPYDKGSAIATLTAVMTEPIGPMPNAGPLARVISGLLTKDPDKRLDEHAARALLQEVVNAPEPPAGAPRISGGETRTSVLPTLPEEPAAPADEPAVPASASAAAPDLDRAREALAAVRRAATKPKSKPAAAHPASPPGAPAGAAPRPARAPLTDVVPRRTLFIVVVAVLAVIAAIIGVLVANTGGGSGDKNGGTTKNGTTAGSTAGSGTQQGTGGKDTAQTSAPATPPGDDRGDDHGGGKGKGKGKAGDDEAAPAPGAAPEGFQLVTANGGAAVALPKGWKRLPDRASYRTGTYYSGPNGARLMVDYTNSPKPSALAEWQKSAAHNSITGYQQIAVKSVPYRTYDAADWEYKRTSEGKQVHVLNRGFVVDKQHGYALLFTTPVDGWNSPENRQMRDVAFATFKPAG
ncbi:serine/threonine-protein kinase [Streptomyces sp. NRRL F-5123]|uniref:serine/threonine-protein kinase n=1 Tax=Streptomyces sp. NRRL F-5123 TaxID=1463856 RepID=UPI0004E1E1C4|nr:serine/threonine-protein kinase [Streptomyces sp. NRRL F-5123]